MSEKISLDSSDLVYVYSCYPALASAGKDYFE